MQRAGAIRVLLVEDDRDDVALVEALAASVDLDGDTTNLVAVDSDGNACVVTTSLGLGSGVKRLNETWHNAEYGRPAPHLREAIEADDGIDYPGAAPAVDAPAANDDPAPAASNIQARASGAPWCERAMRQCVRKTRPAA